MGAVDRGGDGHDVEIRLSKARRLMIEAQTCLIEIVRRDFERVVVTRAQLIDTLAIDVETDNPRARARKGDRDRQTDIAEPDDSDFSRMSHLCPPSTLLKHTVFGIRHAVVVTALV
jgi:hypothetical protein